MEKTGKRRKTGDQLSVSRKQVKPLENQLPPEPALQNIRGPKPKSVLNLRSPLSVAFRHIQGGWREYVVYVDLAARDGNTAMVRYRDCYQGLSKREKRLTWPEQLCELANVSPGELVAAVCRAVWETKASESSMISAMAHPQVLERTAVLAKKADHTRDRELFFRLTGSLPDKKGASINIFNQNQAAAADGALPVLNPARTRFRGVDEEVIEMSRELDAGAPFVVGNAVDHVSPEDNSADA